MAPIDFGQGTRIEDPGKKFREDQANQTAKQQCEFSGGTWDEQTQTCIPSQLKQAKPDPSRISRPLPGADPIEEPTQKGGRPEDIPFGVPLTPEQSARLQDAAGFERSKGGLPSAQEAIQAKELQAQQDAAGQAQAGQIGQFGQLGIEQPGAIGEFDFGEASIAGLRGAIPGAIGGAATAFGLGLIGAKAGALTGAATLNPVGVAVGTVLGFTGGIVAGILSNMNSQRTDTTTAQQRVLDEGKQTLADWRTLAEANPARRQEAIAGFNAQLALIDQAYRQMKLDTSRDVLKFETALPNLAEFEAFYNRAGERDFLVAEMRLALVAQSDVNFAMLELASRRA